MTPNVWQVIDTALSSPSTTHLAIDFNIGLSPDIWFAIVVVLLLVMTSK